MKTEELQMSAVVPASPNQVYAAWLDERQHTAFVGARATVEPWAGGRHTSWDAYATALIVGLDTGKTISLTWRTADFPSDAPDSHVIFRFESIAGGTKVEIIHKGIPEGQSAQYKEAWKKSYLDPMRKLFGKPGALRAAIQEAAKAGRLPIAGVTVARPGTARPFVVRNPADVVKAPRVIEDDGPDDDGDSDRDDDERYSDDEDRSSRHPGDRAPRVIEPMFRKKPVPPPANSMTDLRPMRAGERALVKAQAAQEKAAQKQAKVEAKAEEAARKAEAKRAAAERKAADKAAAVAKKRAAKEAALAKKLAAKQKLEAKRAAAKKKAEIKRAALQKKLDAKRKLAEKKRIADKKKAEAKKKALLKKKLADAKKAAAKKKAASKKKKPAKKAASKKKPKAKAKKAAKKKPAKAAKAKKASKKPAKKKAAKAKSKPKAKPKQKPARKK